MKAYAIVAINDKPKKKLRISKKGGAGSGNWGHAGRPGLVGGSGGSGGKRSYQFGTGTAGDYDPNHPSTQKAADLLNDYTDAYVPGDPWQSADHDTRSFAKRDIINELADRTGVDPEEVSQFIEQWAHSSNDSDMRSLAIQKDAADELGLELSEWQQGNYDLLATRGSANRPSENPLLPPDTQRTLIRAMYDNTQEQLAAQGFKPDDTVRLYRGVGMSSMDVSAWMPGDSIHYEGNTLESWSVGRDIAAQFARSSSGNVGDSGIILEMDVPVRNVIGTARSGFGCLTEGEYIAVGTVFGQDARIAGLTDGMAIDWYKE